LLQQKVTQKVAISLGYFMFSKYHKEPPKVTQFWQKWPNLVTLPYLRFIYTTAIIALS
jgi:hypothetical protein